MSLFNLNGVGIMFRRLGAILLVVGSIFSLSANAATYDLGTLVSGDNEFNYNVSKSAFTDTITFTLGSFSDLAGGIGSTQLYIGSKLKKGISGLSMELFNSLGVSLGSGTDISVPGIQNPGVYHAVITGTGTGSSGGTYGGIFTVSPVPEPSTWAMLIAGLGFLTFMSRRKNAR